MAANKHEIPTIASEKEPEYVGAHSSLTAVQCENWVGETREDVTRCEGNATHTVVMWDGSKLMPIAMCDDCGSPEDAATDRKWSGQLVEGDSDA